MGCKNHYLRKDFDVDHIIPRKKGGGDEIENLQLLCHHCNMLKSNRSMEYLLKKLQEPDADEADKIIDDLIQEWADKVKPEGTLFPIQALYKRLVWSHPRIRTFLWGREIHSTRVTGGDRTYWCFEKGTQLRASEDIIDEIIDDLIEKWKDKDKPEKTLFPSDELYKKSPFIKNLNIKRLKAKGLVTTHIVGVSRRYWCFRKADQPRISKEIADEIIDDLIEEWKDKDKPEGALFPSKAFHNRSACTPTMSYIWFSSRGIVSAPVKGRGLARWCFKGEPQEGVIWEKVDQIIDELKQEWKEKDKPEKALFPTFLLHERMPWSKVTSNLYLKARGIVSRRVAKQAIYWCFEEADQPYSNKEMVDEIIDSLIEEWKDKDKPEGALFPVSDLHKKTLWSERTLSDFARARRIISVQIKGGKEAYGRQFWAFKDSPQPVSATEFTLTPSPSKRNYRAA